MSASLSVASAAASPFQNLLRERRMYQLDRSSTKRLERRDDIRRPVPLVRVGCLGDELLGAREEPAVERLEVAGFGLRGDVRVVDEELRAVPERQQPALCLVRRAVAEAHVLARDLLAVQPAHDVGAHPIERLVGADGIAPRAVHLAPGLVEKLLVRQHAAVRRAADERHGHEGDRVEPQPDLLAHLRHPVGGEPLLPVRVVGQVGRRQALRGARRRTRPGLLPSRCPSRASRAARCPRRARRRRPRGCA